MKRIILLAIPVILALIGIVKYFTLSDLRSDYNLPEDNPEKVKELLAAMAAAHRTHLWDSLKAYEVNFSEAFYGFIGKMGNPFPEGQTLLSMKYVPGRYTGRLKITHGKGVGVTWGIQDGQTYLLDEDQKAIAVDDPNLQFWLPTYQYFIEFPWRIQEATVFRYMGRHEINGQACEGILASWNTLEPQRNIDQYLIWINRATSRIVKIEYTVRDLYPFLTGAASFEQYKSFDGMLLPTEFPVESNLVRDGLLHTMKIVDFKPKKVASKDLYPL